MAYMDSVYSAGAICRLFILVDSVYSTGVICRLFMIVDSVYSAGVICRLFMVVDSIQLVLSVIFSGLWTCICLHLV